MFPSFTSNASASLSTAFRAVSNSLSSLTPASLTACRSPRAAGASGSGLAAVSAAPAAASLRPLAQVVLGLAGLTPDGDYAAAKPLEALRWEHSVVPCVEINQCVGCTR